ncbi:hypothetical protein [Desulfosporosinus acidiphilus]|nr:hypothetical protein [Desulfosporosinus acidiphilus]
MVNIAKPSIEGFNRAGTYTKRSGFVILQRLWIVYDVRRLDWSSEE